MVVSTSPSALMIVSISIISSHYTDLYCFIYKPCNIEIVAHQYIIKSCTEMLISYAVVLQVYVTNLSCALKLHSLLVRPSYKTCQTICVVHAYHYSRPANSHGFTVSLTVSLPCSRAADRISRFLRKVETFFFFFFFFLVSA